MDKHFTVSIFIVHKNKVLLHLHKKAGLMLPLGGHIEKNEHPEETCIREAREESGLQIKLYSQDHEKLKEMCDKEGEKLLVNPVYTMVGEIAPGHHHIDFVYFASTDSHITQPDQGESDILKWYKLDELMLEKNIQENTREMGKRALEILSETDFLS